MSANLYNQTVNKQTWSLMKRSPENKTKYSDQLTQFARKESADFDTFKIRRWNTQPNTVRSQLTRNIALLIYMVKLLPATRQPAITATGAAVSLHDKLVQLHTGTHHHTALTWWPRGMRYFCISLLLLLLRRRRRRRCGHNSVAQEKCFSLNYTANCWPATRRGLSLFGCVRLCLHRVWCTTTGFS